MLVLPTAQGPTIEILKSPTIGPEIGCATAAAAAAARLGDERGVSALTMEAARRLGVRRPGDDPDASVVVVAVVAAGAAAMASGGTEWVVVVALPSVAIYAFFVCEPNRQAL